MTKEAKVRWLAKPEEQDYPAAASYLSLVFDEQAVAKYVEQLRRVEMFTFKAKDIFRASGLSLLGVSNSHVEQDRKKILTGNPFPHFCWCGMPVTVGLSSPMDIVDCVPPIRSTKIH